jgi:hypothetical protein
MRALGLWLVMGVAVGLFPGAARRAFAAVDGDDPGEAAQGMPSGVPSDQWVVVKIPPPAPKPFQLGFEVMQVIAEDGPLAHAGQSAMAVGLRFIFPEGRAIRQHFAFAHHWEKEAGTTRRGFRFDLVALGFPIPCLTGPLRLSVEPVLRVLRGEVLFTTAQGGPGQSLFRIQSGFSLGLTAAYGTWFIAVDPLSVDFRYLRMTQDDTQTGFSRIWSLAFVLGREF